MLIVDIWDQMNGDHNQKGIELGEIKFCAQDWHPFVIHKNAPKL